MDRIGLFTCTCLALLSTSDVSADIPSFSVTIEQIEGKPLLKLKLASTTASFAEERSLFRLWGAEITDGIPKEILDGIFECRERGFFQDAQGKHIRIVECQSAGRDLSRKLIELKAAEEICSETSNAYRTCRN